MMWMTDEVRTAKSVDNLWDAVEKLADSVKEITRRLIVLEDKTGHMQVFMAETVALFEKIDEDIIKLEKEEDNAPDSGS